MNRPANRSRLGSVGNAFSELPGTAPEAERTPTVDAYQVKCATLPEWRHQEAFNAILDKYEPLAREAPQVQRLIKIKGTTADYYDAIREAFPDQHHADFYQGFISGNSMIYPFYAVAHAIRDSQLS